MKIENLAVSSTVVERVSLSASNDLISQACQFNKQDANTRLQTSEDDENSLLLDSNSNAIPPTITQTLREAILSALLQLPSAKSLLSSFTVNEQSKDQKPSWQDTDEGSGDAKSQTAGPTLPFPASSTQTLHTGLACANTTSIPTAILTPNSDRSDKLKTSSATTVKLPPQLQQRSENLVDSEGRPSVVNVDNTVGRQPGRTIATQNRRSVEAHGETPFTQAMPNKSAPLLPHQSYSNAGESSAVTFTKTLPITTDASLDDINAFNDAISQHVIPSVEQLLQQQVAGVAKSLAFASGHHHAMLHESTPTSATEQSKLVIRSQVNLPDFADTEIILTVENETLSVLLQPGAEKALMSAAMLASLKTLLEEKYPNLHIHVEARKEFSDLQVDAYESRQRHRQQSDQQHQSSNQSSREDWLLYSDKDES
ncbi:MAG: hypothetical protein HWE26_17660 [Alteromonadaceae bacterium]|nr:hypothetical protein [Alteromonadaceae bacterium]